MDWVRFLEENYVHYVTRGPNTKKGEVSIKCPMCGDADPSEHLGINLATGFWGCHRDQAHRGKSARTLLKALLGASSHTAQQIIKQYSTVDPDDLSAALDLLLPEPVLEKVVKQRLEPQFNDFHTIHPRGITKRFFQYLQNRGFDNPQDMIKRYDLRCASTGRFKDRIIIPVYLNGELMGWTSRAIGNVKNAPRYLASNQDIKTTVFNFDDIKQSGGQRLIITEGPFDALMIDNCYHNLKATSWFKVGYDKDFRATCTFGTSVVPSQYALLRSLTKRFDETWILFDQGADGPAEELASWIGAKVACLPEGTKDPGELTTAQIMALSASSFSGHFRYHPNYYTLFNSMHRSTS